MKLFWNNARPHTRIKLCGITRLDDVRLAGELGVDAIGLVLVPSSSRYVDVTVARTVNARSLPDPGWSIDVLE